MLEAIFKILILRFVMDFLLVESGEKAVQDLKDMYGNGTSADVDVYPVKDLDTEEMADSYDVVLSRFFLGEGRMGPDILDRFEAETKAIYSSWREEKRENPVLSRGLQKYPLVPEPGREDLEEFVEEYLE